MVGMKEFINKNANFLPILLAGVSFISVLASSSFLVKEKEKISAKRQGLAELQRELTLLDKILVDTRENEEKIKTAIKSLPSGFEEVALFMSAVETKAGEKNQEIEAQIDPNSKKEAGSVSSLKIILRSTGSFSLFNQFLTNLASLSYHTRMDTLNIESAPTGITAVSTFRLYLSE